MFSSNKIFSMGVLDKSKSEFNTPFSFILFHLNIFRDVFWSKRKQNVEKSHCSQDTEWLKKDESDTNKLGAE